MFKFFRAKKGFTIAEIIIGMVLLAILLITIAGVFIGGLSGTKKADKKITSVTLAEAMLDNIMLIPYSNIKNGTFPPSVDPNGVFPPSPYPEESSTDLKGKYVYKITVTDVPGSSGKLKSITVTVSTQGMEREGNTSVTLSTLRTE